MNTRGSKTVTTFITFYTNYDYRAAYLLITIYFCMVLLYTP